MTPPAPGDLARHADALRRLAMSLVGGQGPWEDLVQGTYLAALQKPPTLLSREWLSQVLRNRARDQFRKGAITREEPDRTAALKVQGRGFDPEQVAQRIELHAKLVAAVEALGDPYRETVFLRYFDDLTPTQIAVQLQLPLKTVKTRLGRGLAQLRERLDRELGSEGVGGLLALAPIAALHASTTASVVTHAGSATGIGIMIKKVALACAVVLGLFGIYRYGTTGGDLEHGVVPEGDSRAELALLEPTEEPEEPEVELANVTAGDARGGLAAPAPVDEPVAAGLGTLVVRVMLLSHEPQPGVVLSLRLAPLDGARRGVAVLRSDAAGIVRFENLAPGRYSFYSARGGGGYTLVEADAEQGVDYFVEEGVEVRGVVVDANDDPVAGASVWQTTGINGWMGGHVVATTDGSGHFHLASAPRDQSIGAFGAGHARSALSDLDLIDLTAPPVEVRLVLDEVGVRLDGIVVAPSGGAVAGALVAIGSVNPRLLQRLGAGRPETWTPRSTRTDASGRFQFDGVGLGTLRVSVRADGYATLQTDIEVQGTRTRTVELALVEGAFVEGLVVDAQGEPMPGAIVRAFDQQPTNLDESFVDGGQFDYSGTFAYPFAVANEEGRYVVPGVRPGPVLLFANPPADDLRTQPFAREEIELAAGTRYRWDPVLSTGQTIEGVIRFKSGEPIDEMYINARHEESGKYYSDQTDADGRFELIQLPDGLYTVRVQFWPRLEKGSADPIEVQHVRPGDGLLELFVSIDEPVTLEPGTVRALIDDPAGRLRGNAAAMLVIGKTSTMRIGEVNGAEVRYDDLAPGSYRLHLLFGDDVVHRTDAFDVQPGEDVDLGTLLVEPPGSVHVVLHRPPGTEHVEVSLGAQLVGFVWGTERVGAAVEHTIDELCAGPHVLHVIGRGISNVRVPFEVHAGETVTVECDLEATARRALSLALPEGADPGEVHVVIARSNGETYRDWTISFKKRAARPILDAMELPLGRFSITVECASGLRGQAEIEMSHLGSDQAPVEIELK